MTETRMAEPKGQLATVQALRFAAAFLVVIYHARIFASDFAPAGRAWISPEVIATLATIGRGGVPIFFVISGFIMLHVSYGSFAQPGASRRFALNRAVRIYPLYWITLAAWLAVSPDSWSAFPRTFSELSAMILLWPGEADRIVSVAWTLAFEVYFYAVFAVALVFPRKVGLAFIAVVLMGGVVLGKVFDWTPATLSGEAAYGAELSLFLAGMIIGLVARRLQGQRERWNLAARSACSLAGVIWLLATPWLRDAGLPAVVAYGPAAIILVAGAVFSDVTGWTSRVSRQFSALGDSSYSLYLSHIPVMILAKPTLVALAESLGFGPLGLMLLFSGLAVLCGHLVYLVAERPIQRWVRARLTRTNA